MEYITLNNFYTEPKERYNIITTCYFISNQSYKKVDIYFDGLKRLIKWIPNNYYIRIYFDDSCINPMHNNEILNNHVRNKVIPVINELKHNKKIQLVHFKCEKLSKGIYHQGTFGTIIRFLPFFEDKYNKIISMDIDFTDDDLKAYKNEFFDIINSDDNNEKCYIGYFMGSQFVAKQLIISTYLYNLKYTVTASTFGIKNFYLDNNIINNILKQIIEKNGLGYNLMMKLQKYAKSDEYLMYGCDEIILNYIIYLINKMEISTLILQIINKSLLKRLLQIKPIIKYNNENINEIYDYIKKHKKYKDFYPFGYIFKYKPILKIDDNMLDKKQIKKFRKFVKLGKFLY